MKTMSKGFPWGDESVYGRFDVKIGLGIGAAFNRYTGNLDDLSFRTGVFYVGVGINF